VLSKLRRIREIISWLNFPKDGWELWKLIREHIASYIWPAAVGLVNGGLFTFVREASALQVVVVVVLTFAAIYLLQLVIGNAIRRRSVFRGQPASTETSPENSRPSGAEIAAKRKAVENLLGDALEQGENLQKGMYRQGERLRYANQEDVEMWVDRTHDFIQDVFGKPKAVRFLSREGYTDEELLGRVVHKKYYKRFPPRFLNDKYFLKARVKRLHELCQDLTEINPDFNPEDYPSDWFRR
jgi:hypothetical protein